MARATGPIFNGADVHQNMTDLALQPIESDSGSLLDADLAAMPGGGDDHVQTISDPAHAHASAATGVQAARGAYPFVTQIGDAADALTGAGHAAGRAAVKGAGHALRALDELEFPPAPDVEGMNRQFRSIYHPGG